ANPAGFPILRSGRVASYPVAPAKIFPTFLLDFAVFPGNSGGPVFMSEDPHQADAAAADASDKAAPQFIAGLLTQQVELNSERLEIGIVTHAKFIRETLALVDDPKAKVTIAEAQPLEGARTASAYEAAREQ
ncbi:MAG: serine protease, partial [Caulobacteraceae bacterium]|nr:serine protease [Caulobacteraceae bacterium]